MHLRTLELDEFRLYRRLSLAIPAGGLRITGENASGKSTLVEAIGLLATLRSARSGSDRELIHWRSGQEYGVAPYARAVGVVDIGGRDARIEVGLQVDAAMTGPLRKSVKLNGQAVRAIDAVGELKAVLFAPDDVTLLSGSPAGRRRYLDLFISQIDRRYVRSLARYSRVLEQRNSLLKTLARESRNAPVGSASTQLAFWNDELIVYGSYIVARRSLSCAGLATLVRARFSEFSQSADLRLKYRASGDLEMLNESGTEIDVERVRDHVQRRFEQRLDEARADELRRGVSLIGPHRDDFDVQIDGVAIGTYGSRGQQRLAVVAMKLAEAEQMSREAGEAPLILLDDVLSELDMVHRERLLATVSAAGSQLVITSTDAHLLEHPALLGLPIVTVHGGTVIGA